MSERKEKFTSCEWQKVGLKVCDEQGFTIAKCGWIGTGDEEQEANAQLIASSPVMYRMLDEIRLEAYDAIDEYGCGVIVIPDEVFEKIAKVLATARGEDAE